VVKLGDKYDEWTHKPVLGKPIHFDNELLESLVRVPWWLVPLIWVPLTVAFAVGGLHNLGYSKGVEWLSLIVTGLLSWSLLEYSIHRWIFHCKAESEWFIKIHFLHHGAHHKFPLDKGNLVMHPVPSLAIASILAVIILNTVSVSALFLLTSQYLSSDGHFFLVMLTAGIAVWLFRWVWVFHSALASLVATSHTTWCTTLCISARSSPGSCKISSVSIWTTTSRITIRPLGCPPY
jgi:dihydroceramide fatty acyl 2-hydroxylase